MKSKMTNRNKTFWIIAILVIALFFTFNTLSLIHICFIDSTGLAFLLTRARELMRREGLLSLVNASGEVCLLYTSRCV